MKNNITLKDGKYILNGTTECKTWLEKKTVNGKPFERWHVVLPKDNGTGRTYITKALVDATGTYEFDSKTSGPRVLGTKLTEEAQKQVQALHDQIMAIKNDPKNQVVPTKIDPNSEEAILAAMQKYMAKLSPEAQAKLLADAKAKKVGK